MDNAPGGTGFGLGQMLTQGQMGNTQFAQPTGMAAPGGFMANLAGLFGGQGANMGGLAGMLGGGDSGQGVDMTKLGPLLQMMQMQQMQQQRQQMPQMMGVGPMAGGPMGNMQGQTQASRGYLAQGGGIAPRQIINRG